MLKERISNFLQQLLRDLGETQEGLANRLGIPNTSLRGYLKGTNIPGIDVLLKMAELGNVTLDDLVKTDKPPNIQVIVNNSHGVAFAGRDAHVYVNSQVKRFTQYSPGPHDITGEQANKLKDKVNEIVELEQKVKKKPKTYGAVWNALNRKMGVTYYREIKKDQFEKAMLYLGQWAGRLKTSLKRTDEDEWRKEIQKAIFAAVRNQLGWTKDALDAYIYERYGKESIRDLSKEELEQLKNIIFAKKKGK
ncbi:MAG: helix-turn-helix domain-containing protein [Candidatus Jettenia sp.]|uniref:helix-turn-helix domain-containing protein n=1 Tax=Candidatus Jettenia sp. AMX1 TaxID=2293637 RepID=UPI0013F85572|nr:helix-turn-helix domain-containing protein [Candidatus Jettenia sp. AMX1]MBC6930645.1 helix-turn-helix domain-containing protein [Candidatus Jettenia sp.]MCQ3919295.1 hypothetical protein [Candidatus Brocadia sp.]GJQ47598.1 MAG: hypothetical protein JETCAE04_33520 [Candidatus Jettenia caeni]KAA0246427.1 MAG: helix-turn-helix domain-containing protein [Candidatus Jettenia sp. AMX1]MDL1940676.1 helix-turn-helix domain-containing protein [Candidatus Jettenia sp. AMX1]